MGGRRRRSQLLDGIHGDRSEDGAEIRVQTEGLIEVALRRSGVTQLGINHAGVEEEARLRRVLAERFLARAFRLRIAAVLVISPSERVGDKNILACLIFLFRHAQRLGEVLVVVGVELGKLGVAADAVGLVDLMNGLH